MRPLVVAMPGQSSRAELLAEQIGGEVADMAMRQFPDGECYVRFDDDVRGRSLVVVESLDEPNAKFLPLYFVAETARELKASDVGIVAPYLAYLRQDDRFEPGEAVTSRCFGGLISQVFDWVVTVDPHLHRIERLDQAIHNREAIALPSASVMGAFLAAHTQQPLLLGPDEESEQWVRAIAEPAGLDWAVAKKQRFGDRQVQVALPEREYAQHQVILVDDMISTGNTLINVSQQLRRQGAKTIHCLVTHALFGEQVSHALHQAGIENIWSSDSVPHPSNAVSLAGLLASAFRS